MSEEKIFYATGRRKSSAARVFLKTGNGKITINDRKPEDYLTAKSTYKALVEPLELTKTMGKVDLFITVCGGGETGQAGAIRLGISRALCAKDETLRPTLKKAGFLMRDAREVERKKYGQHGARKKTQYSKR